MNKPSDAPVPGWLASVRQVVVTPPALKESDASIVPNTTTVGRLSALGLNEPWQIPLLLPQSWQDFTQVIRRAEDVRMGETVAIEGVIDKGRDGIRIDRKSRPARLSFRVVLADQTLIWASTFGDSRALQKDLEHFGSRKLMLSGTLAVFGEGMLALRDPAVLNPSWAARARPVYKGAPRVITADTVRRQVILSLRDLLPVAASAIMSRAVTCDEDEAVVRRLLTVSPKVATEQALQQHIFAAHLPTSIKLGEAAQARIERIAAFVALKRATDVAQSPRASRLPPPPRPDAAIRGLPFKLSADQAQAVEDILADLRSGQRSHRLLSGDVGAGKTAVYGLAAVAASGVGGRVAILLPNDVLARQVHAEFTAWWPAIADGIVLRVSGATVGDGSRLVDHADRPRSVIAIGTTALLSDNAVHGMDFVIVDEQQRFSREQREQLGGGEAHLLEVTATCIPRTQALLQYGAIQVSRLQPHVSKDIRTTVVGVENRRRLFDAVRKSLTDGHQVLVVYPVRGDKTDPEGDDPDEKGGSDLPSAVEAFAQWEKLFPGRCVLAHGGQSGEAKAAALNAMRERKAEILVATSVVEVGVNIPGLRHGVVVHAERFGLVALHQLRGRLARTGGAGRFDLYLPKSVGEKTTERLQALVKHKDGFALAEADMLLRGVGDLGENSSRQKGADETILFGRPLSIARLNEVAKIMDELRASANAELDASNRVVGQQPEMQH